MCVALRVNQHHFQLVLRRLLETAVSVRQTLSCQATLSNQAALSSNFARALTAST
jgi:hypothetical protein